MVKQMMAVKAAKNTVAAASKTSKVVAAAASTAASGSTTVTFAGITMAKDTLFKAAAAVLLIGGATTLGVMLTRDATPQLLVNCGTAVETVSASLILYMEGLTQPFTANESMLVQDGFIYNNLTGGCDDPFK